ncbi:exonuclease domain-containing protein [Reichenbachiella versicolor]|uniref:exonuclease domain-containing protein n=1 Tax=Reichenbachiella versicolor TaxID=1821036 RepID=UPI000D6DF119|nr:exonuclease domain-containing protein [Reichenbachiella versicolor]
MYAIVDIETTGRSAQGQKITEIAVILHDGVKIVDEYQTLVNPETSIPYSITQLTGIFDEMVVNAPKFYEIAKKIYEMTEGHTFVAHNVSFDHGILSSEFASLGGEFSREKICTVKLSRQLLPGHKSYSLGNICSDLNIKINGRHRAYGDALATTQLLEILLEKSKDLGEIELKEGTQVRIPKMPPLLNPILYKSLPTTFGIYYFYDAQGEIIYVGKANNIRQRVLSHFNDKSLKERTMFEYIADIKYELTGNELVALLFESAEIKRLMPKYNRAQKRKTETHGLYVYENQNGLLQLAFGKLRASSLPVQTFYSLGQARRYVENIVSQNQLCNRYSGLENTKGSCFGYMIKKCRGVCCGVESVDDYNSRVNELLRDLIIKNEDFFIEEKGRTDDEKAIIEIKGGNYVGFGFIPKSDTNNSYDNYRIHIQNFEHNSDTQRIIRTYLSQNSLPT